MKKAEYITKIAIKTANENIYNVAEAMFDAEIEINSGLEFLAHFDNLSEISGDWNTDFTAFEFDSAIILGIGNIRTIYETFIIDILPEQLECEKMELQLNLDMIAQHAKDYKNGLINVNELIEHIEEITK